MRILTLASLVAAFAASTAQALTLDQRLDSAEEAAQHYWPGMCSPIVVTWVNFPDELQMGWAAPSSSGGCNILLDRSLMKARYVNLCSVMIHESGHLQGLAHSTDPGNVMYPMIFDSAQCLHPRKSLRMPTS